MKLLVDMNLSPSWVKYLKEAGVEAVHWSNIGTGTESDLRLMLWAAEHRCVVLTADLDFAAILAATRSRLPSVIQLRSDNLTPTAIGRAVLATVRKTANELDEGAIVSLDPARTRVRILPLRD